MPGLKKKYYYTPGQYINQQDKMVNPLTHRTSLVINYVESVSTILLVLDCYLPLIGNDFPLLPFFYRFLLLSNLYKVLIITEHFLKKHMA